jgi:hypothetical protein
VSIEGLWIVTFARSYEKQILTGTAVFRDGLILGGDNERCYIGDYMEIDDGIECKVDMPSHTRLKEPSYFFGKADEAKVSVSLKREQDGRFPYIGTGEIQNPIDVSAHFTIALQLAYRLG